MRRAISEAQMLTLIDSMRPINSDSWTGVTDAEWLIKQLLEIEHNADTLLSLQALNDRHQCAAEVIELTDRSLRMGYQIREDVRKAVRLSRLPGTSAAIQEVARQVRLMFFDLFEASLQLGSAISPELTERLNDCIQ